MSITAQIAIAKGKAQIGVPYLWGGDTPAGFDCSGLLFWIMDGTIPRTSQEQWAALPHVEHPVPGDFITFYVNGEGEATHTGMYLSPGWMLDAPETGEDVSIQPFPFDGGYVMGYLRPPYSDGPPIVVPPTTVSPRGPDMNLYTVAIPTDANGDGWEQTMIAWADFLAATLQGSDPATDGGYHHGSVLVQERNNCVLVSVVGSQPDSAVNVFVAGSQ